ncbi:hypothetical protein ACRRTK_003852 [Alexandromys fortis]
MFIPSDWEPQSPRNGKGFVPSSPFPKWIFSVHSQRLHIHLLPSAAWACPSEQVFSPHRLYHMMWDLDTWSHTLFTLLLERGPQSRGSCSTASVPACLLLFQGFLGYFSFGQKSGLGGNPLVGQHCCSFE